MRYLHFFYVLAVVATVVLVGCGKQETPSATVGTNAAPPVPDVGKVVNEKTTAQGFGATAGEAVADAMKMAILQVNGATVQASTVSAKYGLDVSLDRDTASLRASEFAEVVKQRSGGVIQNFRMVDLQEPSAFGGKRYKVTIEAQIAKFNPSTDMQKIKVIIGPIHFDSVSLPMGDRSVSATEVEATLRQRISDALVQTGRFAILDREFSPEIERELDMISSGQAPSAELAKLSQAASADLVWSARASSFAYNRYARQLKTSDRQLVSYSGGWVISEKLVNVATRQVVASDSLRGQAPSIAPTTLSQGVDSSMILEGMSTDVVNQVVASVLRRTFPVTVVALDGTNAVLSQGGQALKEGARYAMVTMGAEMKDPQTGQSLGRIETPCCELVVERVTPNLSYGRLENIRSNLEQLPTGGLQLREQLAEASTVVKASSGDSAVAEDADAFKESPSPKPEATTKADASVPKVAQPKKLSTTQQHPAAASKDDDKW